MFDNVPRGVLDRALHGFRRTPAHSEVASLFMSSFGPPAASRRQICVPTVFSVRHSKASDAIVRSHHLLAAQRQAARQQRHWAARWRRSSGTCGHRTPQTPSSFLVSGLVCVVSASCTAEGVGRRSSSCRCRQQRSKSPPVLPPACRRRLHWRGGGGTPQEGAVCRHCSQDGGEL